VNLAENDRSRKDLEFLWDITLRDTGALETAWQATTHQMLGGFDGRLIH
jgi:hypothetical protein